MRRSVAKTPAPDTATLRDVHATPGHLVRRCHQISVALFLNEVKRALTPIQYASLVAISDRPGIEQKALVDLIAIDRTTVGTVLRGMEAKGLISRTTPADNQRIKQLTILPAGTELLRRTRHHVDHVQKRLLAPLSGEERNIFLKLLSRVVQVNNEFSRAPLRVVSEVPSTNSNLNGRKNDAPSPRQEARAKRNTR